MVLNKPRLTKHDSRWTVVKGVKKAANGAKLNSTKDNRRPKSPGGSRRSR